MSKKYYWDKLKEIYRENQILTLRIKLRLENVMNWK